MNSKTIKDAVNSEYLGYCKQKGDIYSIEVTTQVYHIIAVQDGKVTILITYKTN